MRFLERRPHPSLSTWIRKLWTLDGVVDHAPARELVAPDGCAELIIHVGQPFFEIARTGEPSRARSRAQDRAFVAGQLLAPLQLVSSRRPCVVAARFTPGGAGVFFAVPMVELAERRVALDQLCQDRGELVERLAECRSPSERLDLLERWLMALPKLVKPCDPLVEGVVNRLRSTNGCASVRRLARETGRSPRSLVRLFDERVGLGPKRLGRIFRLQSVLRDCRALLDERGWTWSRLAVEYGYYDQAHLNRDFRELVGETPETWLAASSVLAKHMISPDRPD